MIAGESLTRVSLGGLYTNLDLNPDAHACVVDHIGKTSLGMLANLWGAACSFRFLTLEAASTNLVSSSVLKMFE